MRSPIVPSGRRTSSLQRSRSARGCRAIRRSGNSYVNSSMRISRGSIFGEFYRKGTKNRMNKANRANRSNRANKPYKGSYELSGLFLLMKSCLIYSQSLYL